MDHLPHFFSSLMPLFVAWRPIGYLLFFFSMMIEGDIFLFIAGFLTHQGVFDAGDMFWFLYGGVLIGDSLWFVAGSRMLQYVPAWFLERFDRVGKPFDPYLRARLFHILSFSKFTYGLHHPLLVRAGSLHLPFVDFFKTDLIAAAVWIAVIGGIGYFSSASFEYIRHSLHVAEIGILVIVILFVGVPYMLGRYAKKRL